MNGHSRNDNSILWADSEIKRISIDYDAVTILLGESTGSEKLITCEGYIGYKAIGFWDEMLVKSGTIKHDHPFIIDCLESIRTRYKNSPPSTGNIVRNKNEWYLLQIVLVDDMEIAVACGNVKVRQQ
ncbi:MAG: hypothetical protein GY832_05615 [Chloroflexi bacterium]|nr:hypothetical protein [Chloroflexota bacterium]